ncbi:MAG: YhjD/YihY/BrkB family envelope integrity protein, partial [Acidobacteriota bacterium]
MKSCKQKIPADESPVVTSVWRLGGLDWRTLATPVWNELYRGGLLTHAAALSFYFLFALFPLLIFLITLLGFFVDKGSNLRASLFGNLRRLVPSSAFVLINTTLDEISAGAGGTRLWLGF